MRHNRWLIQEFLNTYDDKYLREKIKVVRKPNTAAKIVMDILNYVSEEITDADDMRDILLLVVNNLNESLGGEDQPDMNELLRAAFKNYRIRA